MKVTTCSPRPILEPCSLDNLAYQVDPYIGCEHFCYYCYVLNQAETDWTREIRIHDDLTRRLGDALEKITPQKIYMGYYTDPYQPCEAQYGQTRKVLELFLEKGFSASILTKSDLVVRDVDVLRKMEDANVSVSVAFDDDRIRRHFEARTIDTEARIDSLAHIKEAGIHTNALLCPIIPYITKVVPLIELLAPHADVIWVYGLSIQERSDPNWLNVEGILEQHFSELKPKIEAAVFDREHPYWIRLRHELREIQKERSLHLNIHI